MTPRQLTTLILRVTMEIGIVAGLCLWGIHTADTTPTKIALGTGAPLIGFGIWGAVDFHQAGRLAEPLRSSRNSSSHSLPHWPSPPPAPPPPASRLPPCRPPTTSSSTPPAKHSSNTTTPDLVNQSPTSRASGPNANQPAINSMSMINR